MKSKLNPIYIIVGLFLFKVALIDNLRNLGHAQQPDDYRHLGGNEMAMTTNLRPIR